MSTSGNYEKFFYAEGKMYSHIMDPRTGYPAQGMLSTSVIAPRTLDSEAWTKPYYILGPPMGGRNTDTKTFAFIFAKRDQVHHANGFNEQSIFGCLPPPADRCSAGLVYAAGRTLHETIPGYPRQGRDPRDLQAARSGGAGDPAAGGSSGRRRRHHLRRPAAAGGADGPEAEVRRTAKDRRSTIRSALRTTWIRSRFRTPTNWAMWANRFSWWFGNWPGACR